ncbi:hypothetical protein, partial [Mesorhizobium sp. M2A.F.Ca.ET.037.01.1.1]|uniref:hypothetical protein n=1 Tax=Mesorhizobium sp. M2A.F.Ca.ET.037.01.1.1 TaxID=2496748 RepID=UPI001AEC7E96
ERIVELVEVVDIEHDDCQRLARALHAPQFPAAGFFEITPVEQAGVRIADRLLPKRFAKAQIG